jgi:predicted amidohydrolase YtcJ
MAEMIDAPTLITNAKIVTMDPLVPCASALLVRQGRVAALGNEDDMRAIARPGARQIDAGGRLVLPGFQDTHIHLQDAGHGYNSAASLDDARSVPALLAILRREAARRPEGWVEGAGWYAGIFTEHNLDRHVLDAAVPDRPCYIVASDGHNACLNSRACEAIGLASGTSDPLNGHFVRDREGDPTGMLHEEAVFWAEKRMPETTDAQYADGVRYAQALCNRHGITGVLDAAIGERHARVYERLAQAGELTVRVAATAKVFPHESTEEAVARLCELRRAAQSEMFKVHSAKFFLDGVFENRTAAMLEPYSDAAGGNAPLMFGHNQVKELFTAFDAARFQIHVHVIGDGAARAALDGLEAARLANGGWPSLHQIAHVQSIDPADIPRFRALGAMANVQPLWARNEPSVTEMTLPLVGPERGKSIYAFRSLIDAGAPFCLSSDWGVSTLNPFPIMETALTRQPPAKEGRVAPFLPEQRMTREECVRGYTVNAAAAAWRADGTGSLSVGKSADLIILDHDIFTCNAYDIGDTRVLLTLLAGREVYRDPVFVS